MDSDRVARRAKTLGDSAAVARRPTTNKRQAGRASAAPGQRCPAAARHRLQHGPAVHGTSLNTEVCDALQNRKLEIELRTWYSSFIMMKGLCKELDHWRDAKYFAV